MRRLWIIGMLGIACCSSNNKIVRRSTDNIAGNWVITSLIDPNALPIGTFLRASNSGYIVIIGTYSKSYEFTLVKTYATQYVYKIKNKRADNNNSCWYSIVIYNGVAYISNKFEKSEDVHSFVESGQMPTNEFAQIYT